MAHLAVAEGHLCHLRSTHSVVDPSALRGRALEALCHLELAM